LINIAQINLDNRKLRAEKFLSNVRDTEIDVAKSLEDKYGKGTVNLTTGEFNATNLK
jgi:hypothetical protein